MSEFGDKLLAIKFNEIFGNKACVDRFKTDVNDKFQYHQISEVTVQMPFGTHQKVKSPWFKKKAVNTRTKKGPKSRNSPRKGSHLFIELLGFEGMVSHSLASKALKWASLCPSSEIASNLLKDEGITFSQNKIRAHIGNFTEYSNEERAELSIHDGESLAGKRVLLCVDGGRIRSRINKPGKIPKTNKRHGFNTDWREPKLFTIYTLQENGEVDESFNAHVDGKVGNEAAFMKLLEAYLKKLEIHNCKDITFVGDGAKWQWRKVPALLKKLKVKRSKITEVIDYMHARQNLYSIIENCSKGLLNALHDDLKKEAESLLYGGNIKELGALIKEHSNKGFVRSNMKKWKSYFDSNSKRMQYELFDKTGHPKGSGAVESAIRRVINLRIKSPSTFWLPKNAEAMIFIRSKVLYGRWEIVNDNIIKKKWNCLIQSRLG